VFSLVRGCRGCCSGGRGIRTPAHRVTALTFFKTGQRTPRELRKRAYSARLPNVFRRPAETTACFSRSSAALPRRTSPAGTQSLTNPLPPALTQILNRANARDSGVSHGHSSLRSTGSGSVAPDVLLRATPLVRGLIVPTDRDPDAVDSADQVRIADGEGEAPGAGG
jgi:hypothetical protein